MDVKKILSEMTLEEKARLCQGADFWHTVPVERLGVPAMMVSDGPYGLRKQDEKADHLGVNESIKAVCYPTSAGTACSFDTALMEELGQALGQTCQAENVGVLLGPAANIKRSPLCGRNFEYCSEDPFLSGEIAGAYIRGVQSQGVGTSLKHFAANNQETRRMSVSAQIPERALREIYLASFEGAVKHGDPWTLMCSYNKIDGVYSSENKWLLTDLLRGEWGYKGAVMTDWGACNDHVKGVAAGLELEMPRSGDFHDEELIEAVRSGKLDEAVLDQAAERMLNLINKYVEQRKPDTTIDLKAQHALSRRIAREAMVLLKNDGALLPLGKDKQIAFIGRFAEQPRFQGGGSSHINCSEELSALAAVREVCPVTYAPGYNIAGDAVDETLETEAVKAAEQAEIAVLFLGLPDAFESEGYDRDHMRMPACQEHLLNAVLAVQKNVVVVLHNGSPVEMPWVDRVPAILEAYLGGQAGGGAVVDLLFGAASPCGKLAETFPVKLEDTPSFLNFPGEMETVTYAEGIYVGYRYYDKKKLPVLFPFGHGLSYTTFAYGNLRLSTDVYAGGEMTVSVDVTNTGSMAGKEVVQFYVRADHAGKDRPVRELKGFGKIALAPGETGTVSVTLDSRAFAYWEEHIHDWYVEPGKYVIEVAASSRDIRQSAAVTVESAPLKIHVTLDTTFGDAMRIPGAQAVIGELTKHMAIFNADPDSSSSAAISPDMLEAMMRFMPLHCLCAYAGGGLTPKDLVPFVDKLNEIQK